jgi:hypothetical protein
MITSMTATTLHVVKSLLGPAQLPACFHIDPPILGPNKFYAAKILASVTSSSGNAQVKYSGAEAESASIMPVHNLSDHFD